MPFATSIVCGAGVDVLGPDAGGGAGDEQESGA